VDGGSGTACPSSGVGKHQASPPPPPPFFFQARERLESAHAGTQGRPHCVLIADCKAP
jgi:hypothetical protein